MRNRPAGNRAAQQTATTPSTDDLIASVAIEYAIHHWRVFPLRGKNPAIPYPHPKGSPDYGKCKGECGLQGHGVLDATDDITTITAWWSGRYAGCNIGGRIPESMIVLDIDPRNGGDESLAAHEKINGKMPDTLTTISGRGDSGVHLFFRRPPGKLSSRRLGPGIDIKTSTGYVVLPPSIHPDTGPPVEHDALCHPAAGGRGITVSRVPYRGMTPEARGIVPIGIPGTPGTPALGDGQIEAPSAAILDGNTEVISGLNSDQLRELSSAALEAAAELDGWAAR